MEADNANKLELNEHDGDMVIEEQDLDKNKRRIRFAVELLITFAIAILTVFLIKTFVAGTYEIPSGSMIDTIEIGDRVISERVSYRFREPANGEIVTFEDPEEKGRTLIKRVIAVGGQTVDLVNGKVVLDGKELVEDYTQGSTRPLNTASGKSIEYPITIPDGYIWVMGDNREYSADSRYFGPVPISSVSGHATLRYWPFNRLGELK